MSGLVGLRAARSVLVVAVIALLLAFTPVTHPHEVACAHDTSGVCSASAADRMDKGDSVFDPSHEPGPPGPSPARAVDASAAEFEVIGTYDPGTGSLADVWAHKGVAYLGSWVVGCMGQGVRAISLADPENPTLLSTFGDSAGEPDVSGTWTEKVIVQRVNTPNFHGDLAAVSFQNCSFADQTSFRGFGVYDVTDPANPQRLALVRTASRGSHEIWLESRPGGAFVYTAVQRAEERTSDGGIGGEKDFQVWDVSNPTEPVRVAQWGAWEELGLAPNTVRGIAQVHSVIGDGRRAYLAYWDHGTIILDMTNPSNPVFLGKTDFEDLEEGNAHSNAVWGGGNLMIQNDEDFNPAPSATREQAWGYPRFFDISDPANPRRLGTFELPTTRQFPAPDAGDYTVHDVKVRGSVAFFSWYAEGIVAVDVSRVSGGRQPQFIAQWKPPLPNPDPSGGLPDTGQVWGVALERGLVLAADQNSGLYVLRLRRGSGAE
jgi:hypothetical protein